MDRSKNFLNLLTVPVFFKNTNFHRRIAQFVCPLRSVLFRYNSFARVPLTTSLLTGGGILLFSLSLPPDSRLSFFRFLGFLFSLSSPLNRFSCFSVFPPAQPGFVMLRATSSRVFANPLV